jgi:hypothetical protein
MTSGSVDGASFVSNVSFMHELESINCLTSVATIISHIARNDDLGGDVYIRPGSLSGNFDSVRES